MSFIETAIVRAGIAPFFQQFNNFDTVETRLAHIHDATMGLQQVLARSLAVADFVRDWAGSREIAGFSRSF